MTQSSRETHAVPTMHANIINIRSFNYTLHKMKIQNVRVTCVRSPRICRPSHAHNVAYIYYIYSNIILDARIIYIMHVHINLPHLWAFPKCLRLPSRRRPIFSGTFTFNIVFYPHHPHIHHSHVPCTLHKLLLCRSYPSSSAVVHQRRRSVTLIHTFQFSFRLSTRANTLTHAHAIYNTNTFR